MKNCVYCGNKKYKKVYIVRGFDIVTCQTCGLTRTLQKPNVTYTNYHRDENEYTKDEELFRNIFEKRYKNVSKYFDKPGKVLDIGASTGTMLSIFKKRGWTVWGVEPSRSAKYARKKGIKITNSSFESAKLPANYFDLIIMNHTFEHVSDPVDVLEKIKQLLKKGGIIYIDVPNFDSWDARLKKAKWGYLMPEEHTFHYTPKVLKQLLERSEFDVVWIKTWTGVFDVAKPLNKYIYNLKNLRLSFIKDLIKIPFDIATTYANKGTSLAVLGKKG